MFPKLPSTLFLLALVVGQSSVSAETRTLTRDEAIRIAFANQPDLQVAAIQIDRASSRLRWSGRLENPELELSVNDDGVGLDEGEGGYEVAFAQRFPLTARLRHEKSLRRHQVILAEAELAERRRDLAGQVDLALIEWLATRERGRLIADGITLNEEILKFLEEQASAGEISKLDAMQARLEARTLGQERDRLAAREKQERLGLLRLLGLGGATVLHLEATLNLPDSSPPDRVDLEAILSHRPDHVLALARIDQAKAALVLEESKRWEDVSLKFFVEGEKANDQPTGLERNTFTGIGLSIPLPLRQRNEDGIEQARLDGEESVRSVEAARFRIRGECEEAYRARSDAWGLASEAADELPALAKQQLEAIRAAHVLGEATFLQVRQAQEQVLEVSGTALDFLVDYHRAEARVRLVTGAYPGLATPSESK